jgi:competence protein ComEA
VRALIHLAAFTAVLALAFALGRWLRDPEPGAHITALLVLAGVTALALRRLYRPGGLARPAAAERAGRPARLAGATSRPAGATSRPAGATSRSAQAAPRPADAAPLWATDARLDLNSASATELETLPGIGPVTARRIIDSRAVDGPFRSVEDLVRVGGFGPARVRAVADRVRAS